MDRKDALKSMLNNLINDRQEEASLDLHNYLTGKMRDVSGLGTPPVHSNDDREVDFDGETDPVE